MSFLTGLLTSKKPFATGGTAHFEELNVSEWEGEGKFAIVVHNVFSADECTELIARSEAKGYEAALLNIGGGRQVEALAVRRSKRTIIDDPALAEEMWSRIIQATSEDPRLMQRMSPRLAHAMASKKESSGGGGAPIEPSHHAVGLNERLRFLKYEAGDYFSPHSDGCYVRRGEAGPERRGECSMVTCQLYLNEGFEGGATRFMDFNDETKVTTRCTTRGFQ